MEELYLKLPIRNKSILNGESIELCFLSLDEKIQRVEDLTMLIDRWRTLNDSRRKLQTFQIGADTLSSVILLWDAAGNEFKASNSTVITSVMDEMKRTLETVKNGKHFDSYRILKVIIPIKSCPLSHWDMNQIELCFISFVGPK